MSSSGVGMEMEVSAKYGFTEIGNISFFKYNSQNSH